ncbi:hypothetical protein NQ315_012272 [Exocentrus adspersus]|uniref:Tyr recombinase domain-containing protein n=1 Tax=Exocentrus adspersus TaxID=1586481 RepID=A0AAV8VEW8_9CUCU|nr:hypothetical protein NQ315_012272 [Exocentrus adspersus]
MNVPEAKLLKEAASVASSLLPEKSSSMVFQKVIAFLKRKNERYIPRKAKVLSKEQVERFLLDAPDDLWLLAKIVTIFGIFGCCRCDELLSLAMNDVEDMGKYEPELYTGHCFRRTGATMVVDAGGDILSLKHAGGWKSSEIAMSYVDDSINNKI